MRSSQKSNPSKITLFGKKYRLDRTEEVSAFLSALDAEIQRSIREEPLGKAHQQDPVHCKLPKNYIDNKLRRAMEATRQVAQEFLASSGERKVELRKELLIMAGALHGSFRRILPGDMDVLEAMQKQSALRHPPTGKGQSGMAGNLTEYADDPSLAEPALPSGFWNRPSDLPNLDLYYGFGRSELPDLRNVALTYLHSKQSRGGWPGFDVKCERYGHAKIKFGEEYSQPVAHRLFWALGYNTIPVDFVPVVRVKWDRRIFTEFNTRQDQTMTVRLFGLFPVYVEHLQRYTDPLQPVSEVIMRDENGQEVTLKPNPDWSDFKRRLYKVPAGRPETIENNFNDAFADRIEYLVYRNVNFRKDDDDEAEAAGRIFLGNWDWEGEDNPALRENRGFMFASAWLNQFDSWAQNNKLYLIPQEGTRTFKYYVTDLGGCLGPASDAYRMQPQQPNAFPWAFTHPACPGETAVPLDGSFYNIHSNTAFKAADIHDARWMARYMAQLTGKQILEALVASGMPSAKVRLYYNKLVCRRNKALADLGLDYPPIAPMDESKEFNYDPQTDGLVSIVTCRNETVTAPDEGWVVVKGRVCRRAESQSAAAVRKSRKAETRGDRVGAETPRLQ